MLELVDFKENQLYAVLLWHSDILIFISSYSQDGSGYVR